jgi:Protein of unknown function (DUF2752)
MSCIPKAPELEQQRFVINRVVAIVACLTLLAAPFVWNAWGGKGPVLCITRGVTGLPCPGCGLTRAMGALARLDLPGALAFNMLCVPLVVLAVVTPITALHELSRGVRCRWYRFLYSSRVAKWSALAVVCYHLTRLAVWTADGTLVNEYLKSAWIYRVCVG